MKIVYHCDMCNASYDTLAAAEACEKDRPRPKLKVGDIVHGKSGWTWFNGDPLWIENHAARGGQPSGHQAGGLAKGGKHARDLNCFGPCCTYSFYYVVVKVDYDEHRCRYWLVTGAMNGKEGHLGGRTYDSGHIAMRKVRRPPPFVVESSKALLHERIPHLL